MEGRVRVPGPGVPVAETRGCDVPASRPVPVPASRHGRDDEGRGGAPIGASRHRDVGRGRDAGSGRSLLGTHREACEGDVDLSLGLATLLRRRSARRRDRRRPEAARVSQQEGLMKMRVLVLFLVVLAAGYSAAWERPNVNGAQLVADTDACRSAATGGRLELQETLSGSAALLLPASKLDRGAFAACLRVRGSAQGYA